MTQQCTNVHPDINPYMVNLSTSTLRTATPHTGRMATKHKYFRGMFFYSNDENLLKVKKTLRNWAAGAQTTEQQKWLETFFMKLFHEHFIPIDSTEIEVEELDFNYFGDGNFAPNTPQGVTAESKLTSEKVHEIKWIFQIAPDGNMNTLEISYEGYNQFRYVEWNYT